MTTVFYLSAAVAIIATVLAISRLNAVHALLNLVVSLLAIAIIFYLLGAPFVAALEVIIYAGAIMVVFVFVVMMLNAAEQTNLERQWLQPKLWIIPGLLAAVLLAELIYVLTAGAAQNFSSAGINPKQVGLALYGPYLLGVELASFLLLSGLVGAYHLGHRYHREKPRQGGF